MRRTGTASLRTTSETFILGGHIGRVATVQKRNLPVESYPKFHPSGKENGKIMKLEKSIHKGNNYLHCEEGVGMALRNGDTII